jgi:phenylalanyl-tRNA synthetase alpha chain
VSLGAPNLSPILLFFHFFPCKTNSPPSSPRPSRTRRAPTRPSFEAAKARYVGPNGELTALMKQMGAVPKEQRPAIGKLINETKAQLQAQLDAALAPSSPPSSPPSSGPRSTRRCRRPTPARHLPSAHARARGDVPHPAQGRLHRRRRPRGRDRVLLLRRAQHPADHPARDAQDTFYFPDSARFGNVSKKCPGEKYLLRTHTSSVQIRTMLKGAADPHRVARAASTAATPPTRRTAPTSTSSNASTWTRTSPCAT